MSLRFALSKILEERLFLIVYFLSLSRLSLTPFTISYLRVYKDKEKKNDRRNENSFSIHRQLVIIPSETPESLENSLKKVPLHLLG